MKKSHRPITRKRNPQPEFGSPDWVIWTSWVDRITFKDIKFLTGKSESDVIKIIRSTLKSSSFRLWRKRIKSKIKKDEILNW